jgi:hypothetical protein
MGIYMTKRYFLDADWRRVICITTVVYVVIDATVAFTTIFNGIRSQWFWLGAPVLSNIPQGIRFIVSGFITVEVADIGYEATTYGLITTVHNLASPFSTAISNQVNGYFATDSALMEADAPETRWQVAYAFAIMYLMKLLSNVFLLLLPRQKAEAQQLKRSGGKSVLAASIAFFIALFALVWGVMINLMSIFPSTACFSIAGGPGCH